MLADKVTALTFQLLLLCSINDGNKGKSSHAHPDFRPVQPAPAASNSEWWQGQGQVQVHDRPSPSTHSSKQFVFVFKGIVETSDLTKNDR
jgi:hypothetical protein